MKEITLGQINSYEQGHCDRNDNDDLLIKKYLLIMLQMSMIMIQNYYVQSVRFKLLKKG